MKSNYQHVIWDFNGTILNDMQAGIDAVNVMLAQRGLPMLRDLEEYRAKFDFPVREYYRRLGFDFDKEDYHTVLAPLWVSLYEENSKSSPIFDGVEQLCARLRKAGAMQSVLSASQTDMLKKQLAQRGALQWFDEIWGCDSIHAYGKEELAGVWREAHPGESAVLIGDTVHDFQVATSIGADCILLACGYHSRQRLMACGAPVVSDLFECASLLLK